MPPTATALALTNDVHALHLVDVATAVVDQAVAVGVNSETLHRIIGEQAERLACQVGGTASEWVGLLGETLLHDA